MSQIEHRAMTLEEEARVRGETWAGAGSSSGWSSRRMAIAILLGASFIMGLLLFGLPAVVLLDLQEGSREARLALVVPGVVTMVVAGVWSVAYYLRGEWRAHKDLLEDLDYGRVEVVDGALREAWVVEDEQGTTWLLELDQCVLVLAPGVPQLSESGVFPGSHIHLVRCMHSGMVLDLALHGSPLAPSARFRGLALPSVPLSESARYTGSLEEVFEPGLRRVA